MEVQLTRGQVAKVCACHASLVGGYKWFAMRSQNRPDLWYAARTVGTAPNRKLVLMHRVITQASDGVDVDHADHNGLNNQCSNLRTCSRHENQHNRRVSLGKTTSKHKGVYWMKNIGKWHAQIYLNGKNRHLGFFDNENDAARAYRARALAEWGEFAGGVS